jgi:hypothetical protein
LHSQILTDRPWCQREEAREQLLFLGEDVFLVTPLTEKLHLHFFRKIKCATAGGTEIYS